MQLFSYRTNDAVKSDGYCFYICMYQAEKMICNLEIYKHNDVI
jgi:hypothetical protein